MTNLIGKFIQRVNPLWRDQRGITGLETAIVLIAFVVVSSVFAFAALSTGLFTTDKAKETIHAGLSEARSTMEMKGSILATNGTTGNNGTVGRLTFQVTSAAAAEAIDLSVGNTLIKYTDIHQTYNFDSGTEFTSGEVGTGDGDSLLERGEVFEISVDVANNLTTPSGHRHDFHPGSDSPQGSGAVHPAHHSCFDGARHHPGLTVLVVRAENSATYRGAITIAGNCHQQHILR